MAQKRAKKHKNQNCPKKRSPRIRPFLWPSVLFAAILPEAFSLGPVNKAAPWVRWTDKEIET